MMAIFVMVAAAPEQAPSEARELNLLEQVIKITASDAPLVRWTREQVSVRQPPSRLPERLERVIEARTSNSSHVTWTLQHLPNPMPLNYPENHRAFTEHFVTQTTGESLWQRNFGNEWGRHPRLIGNVRSALQEPGAGHETIEMYVHLTDEPHDTILYERNAWHKKGRDVLVGVSPPQLPGANAPYDLRACGIRPMMGPNRFNNELGIPYNMARRWRDAEVTILATPDGGEIIVAESGNHKLEWALNSDGQPLRASLFRGGELEAESITELQKVGDQWFPLSTAFYRGGEPEPYMLLTVEKASFDQDWHRRDPFVPEDIGVGFGHQLTVRRPSRLDDSPHSWDGLGLITRTEFLRMLWLYEVDMCDEVLAYHDRFSRRTPEEPYLDRLQRSREQIHQLYLKKHGELPVIAKLSDEPDEWNVYVAEFIKKHQLDEHLQEIARKLLKQAKRLRDLNRKRTRTALRKARSENNTVNVDRLEQNEMEKRIFDRLLVRGLLKLLPKEEREKHRIAP